MQFVFLGRVVAFEHPQLFHRPNLYTQADYLEALNDHERSKKQSAKDILSGFGGNVMLIVMRCGSDRN